MLPWASQLNYYTFGFNHSSSTHMKHFYGISCCASASTTIYKTIAPPKIPIPNAPQMKILPLPSPSVSPPLSISPGTNDLYPLTIHDSTHLSSLQQSKLESILLTSPIQLRTPTAHIGTLHNDTPRRTISALDAFIILKTLIPSGSMPPRLSSTIQTTVEIPCIRRRKESPVGDAQISLFGRWSYLDISGCGPLPEDSNVWGFEVCDFGGNSVIHLA